MPTQNILQTGPVSNKELESLNGGYKTDSDIRREKALRRRALEGYMDTLSGPKIKFSSEEPQEGYVGMTPYQQQHLNDYRASEQSFLKHAVYGLGQNLITAGTAMGELLLSPFTAGYAAATGNSYWDNAVTETASKILDWSREVMPNYEFDNATWYQNFGSKFQSFLEMMGYTEGFIGGTLLGGSILRGIGVVGKAASVGKSGAGLAQSILGNGITKMLAGTALSSYAEAEDQTYNDMKQWKEVHNKNLEMDYNQQADMLANIYFQNKGKEFVRLQDGRVEDRAFLEYKNGMQELENNKKEKQALIDNKATEMGDNIFAANVALLMTTNMLEFGHLFRGGFRQSKRAFTALEKDGHFSIPTKRIKAKAYGRAGLNALSEGFQEKAQGSFTTIAGNYYDDVLKRYEEGDSEEAFNSTMTFMENFIGGLHHAVTTTENMEEAIMGGLTAIVGVPMITKGANRNASIGRDKFFGISGGLYGEIREANEYIKNAKEGVDVLNSFYANQDSGAAALRAAVRYNKYSKDAMEAVMLNDKFGYENAKVSQAMTLINAFDNAGKLQELKDHVAGIENVSDEDIPAILELTTKTIKNENNEDIEVGPYIKQTSDGKSVRMSNEEIKEALRHNAEEINTFIDDYTEIKNSLDRSSNRELSNTQLETLTWMYGQLKNFNRRQSEINYGLSDVIKDAVVYYNGTGNTEGAQKVSALISDIGASFKLINGKNDTEERNIYREGYDLLDNYVNNESTTTYLPDVYPKIADAKRINNAYFKLKDLYDSFMKNPEKMKKSLIKDGKEKIREYVSKRKEDKKFKPLTDAKTFKEFREAKNKLEDSDFKDYLDNNPEKQYVKEWKEWDILIDAINAHKIKGNTPIDDISDEEWDEAVSVLDNYIDQVEEVEDLKNLNTSDFTEASNDNVREAIRTILDRAMGVPKKRTSSRKSENTSNQDEPSEPVPLNTTLEPLNPKVLNDANINKPIKDVADQSKVMDMLVQQYNEEAKQERLAADKALEQLLKNADILPYISKARIREVAIETLRVSEWTAEEKGNVLYKDNLNDGTINNFVENLIIAATPVEGFKNPFSIDKFFDNLSKAISRKQKGNTKEDVKFQNYYKNLAKVKEKYNEVKKDKKKVEEILASGYSRYNTALTPRPLENQYTLQGYQPRIQEYTLDGKQRMDNVEGIRKNWIKWRDRMVSEHHMNYAEVPNDNHFKELVHLHNYLDKNNCWENARNLKVGDEIRLGVLADYKNLNGKMDPTEIFMLAKDENGEFTKIVGSVRHAIIHTRINPLKETLHEAYGGLANVEQNIIKQFEEQKGTAGILKNNIYYYPAKEPLKVTKMMAGFLKRGEDGEYNNSLSSLGLKNLDRIFTIRKLDNGTIACTNRKGTKLSEYLGDSHVNNILEKGKIVGTSLYIMDSVVDGAKIPISLRSVQELKADSFKSPEEGTLQFRFREAVRKIVHMCISNTNNKINNSNTPDITQEEISTIMKTINSYVHVPLVRGINAKGEDMQKTVFNVTSPYIHPQYGYMPSQPILYIENQNGTIDYITFIDSNSEEVPNSIYRIFDEVRKKAKSEEDKARLLKDKVESLTDSMIETLFARYPNLMVNVTGNSLASSNITDLLYSNIENTTEYNVNFITSRYAYNDKGEAVPYEDNNSIKDVITSESPNTNNTIVPNSVSPLDAKPANVNSGMSIIPQETTQVSEPKKGSQEGANAYNPSEMDDLPFTDNNDTPIADEFPNISDVHKFTDEQEEALRKCGY